MKKIYNKLIILAFGLLMQGIYLPSKVHAQKVDYTSKLESYQFNFSNDLENQEKELEDNAWIIRFKESRENQASDRYRPIFHYVNPEGNLNDPNGLCFWNGNWHLFYQAYPPEDPRQHWGHAISKDLVHWRDLPLAIYPNPERAVYSGSTYAEDDRVIAIYHGTMVGNMVATSSDPLLLNWEKVEGLTKFPVSSVNYDASTQMVATNSNDPINWENVGKAAIPFAHPSGFPLPYSVFDPSIWKEENTYYALSAGRNNDGHHGQPTPEAHLFRSKDLQNWQYMHPFVEGDRFSGIGDDYACPYFWPIGDKHIMLFYSHRSGGQYLLGNYDQKKHRFEAAKHGKFNHGASNPSGVHAPSATPDGKGGVIAIFNMNPGKPTKGWNQIMTLPMRLTLKDEKLKMEPAGAITSLRTNHQRIDNITLSPNQHTPLKNIKGDAMELNLVISPENAQMIELNVLESPGQEEFTRIKIFPYKGYHTGLDYWKTRSQVDLRRSNPPKSVISLETSYSSTLPDVQSRPMEMADFDLGLDENIELRIFIDKSVVEVYVNNRQYLAARVYPGLQESQGVSLKAQGGSSKVISVDAWEMKNTWNLGVKEWKSTSVWR